MLTDLWSQETNAEAGWGLGSGVREGGHGSHPPQPLAKGVHMATQGLHDVYFLSLGEVEDFFGSWANNFIILTNRKQRIVAIDIAIRQHHGWVVLIHHITRDLADQAGVGTVSHGQGLRQLVQRAAADRAVRAL